MQIAILGLGYVGTAVAACLLEDGHRVYGVDPDPTKVSALVAGTCPFSETGVDAILKSGCIAGKLNASTTSHEILENADIAIVCVGTEGRREGTLDVRAIISAATDIGAAVRRRDPAAPPLIVLFRSTLAPGTMDKVVLPALAASAQEGPGRLYEPVFNPEFLREGTALEDYRHPPEIVLGERFPGASRHAAGLYDDIEAPFHELAFAEAEFVKIISNCFHATKVAFANEVGRLCIELGVNPQRVIDVFLADRKLNISTRYLRPGGAFGGSCLPKDVRATVTLACERGLDTPLLTSLISSNEAHKAYLCDRLLACVPVRGRILLLGLSFKRGTDDLRGSPLVDLAHDIVASGRVLFVHDPDLTDSPRWSAGACPIREQLGEIADLLVEDLDIVTDVDLVVFAKTPTGPLPPHLASLPSTHIHRLAGFPRPAPVHSPARELSGGLVMPQFAVAAKASAP
jgi:GDP-mannose 6-dehydrogenase